MLAVVVTDAGNCNGKAVGEPLAPNFSANSLEPGQKQNTRSVS